MEPNHRHYIKCVILNFEINIYCNSFELHFELFQEVKLRHDFNFEIIQDQVLKKAIIKEPLFKSIYKCFK